MSPVISAYIFICRCSSPLKENTVIVMYCSLKYNEKISYCSLEYSERIILKLCFWLVDSLVQEKCVLYLCASPVSFAINDNEINVVCSQYRNSSRHLIPVSEDTPLFYPRSFFTEVLLYFNHAFFRRDSVRVKSRRRGFRAKCVTGSWMGHQ